MITRNLLHTIFLMFLLLVVSCNEGFEEMNTDRYNFVVDLNEGGTPASEIDFSVTISPEALQRLKENEATAITNFNTYTYEGLYNDYQRSTNLTHDIYCAYVANNNLNFVNSSPNYIYTEGWSGKRWDHFYQKRCNEYTSMAKTFYYVDRAKYKNVFYITRIYFAFLASTMTDTYGAIPFSVFLRGETIPEKLPYDSQEKIYDLLFKTLEQAADSLKPGAGGYQLDKPQDRCYQGDEGKWLRFANTLRLRLALRIANIDPSRAKSEGEAAMSHPGGLMKDDGDNMKTIPRYAPIDLGGDNSGGDENIQALCSFSYLDACMSKDMELAYKNQSSVLDTRCEISWFRPTPHDALKIGVEYPFTEYTGCKIGSDEIKRLSDTYSVLKCNQFEGKVLNDKYWFGYCRESVWMSYSESRFLLAEASLRGWAGAAKTPHEYFEEGIRASMNYYRIATQKAESYLSGLVIYGPGKNPFTGTDKEAMLEQIITQKWLAVFPNGNEGWAEFRRTDYPVLRNHLSNRSSDVPQGKFIKRVRYPASEFDYNSENVPMNVNQGTRVWWDVADTNDDSGKRMITNNFR